MHLHEGSGEPSSGYGPLVPPITDVDPATKSSWCPEDWEKRLGVVRQVCVPPTIDGGGLVRRRRV
jgi:hypothetical protein